MEVTVRGRADLMQKKPKKLLDTSPVKRIEFWNSSRRDKMCWSCSQKLREKEAEQSPWTGDNKCLWAKLYRIPLARKRKEISEETRRKS